MQAWLPASLSVIPNTAFLQRVKIPHAMSLPGLAPGQGRQRDEMSACVKSIHLVGSVDNNLGTTTGSGTFAEMGVHGVP